ncbi:hypothetical protein ACLIA0_15150 [Bacillaceae bacterium W0354]
MPARWTKLITMAEDFLVEQPVYFLFSFHRTFYLKFKVETPLIDFVVS